MYISVFKTSLPNSGAIYELYIDGAIAEFDRVSSLAITGCYNDISEQHLFSTWSDFFVGQSGESVDLGGPFKLEGRAQDVMDSILQRAKLVRDYFQDLYKDCDMEVAFGEIPEGTFPVTGDKPS